MLRSHAWGRLGRAQTPQHKWYPLGKRLPLLRFTYLWWVIWLFIFSKRPTFLHRRAWPSLFPGNKRSAELSPFSIPLWKAILCETWMYWIKSHPTPHRPPYKLNSSPQEIFQIRKRPSYRQSFYIPQAKCSQDFQPISCLGFWWPRPR